MLAPSTFEEAYTFAGLALNYSDIYQHPVILLSDKQLSESYLTIDTTKLQSTPVNRGKRIEKADSESDTYKRYEYTTDGISPYSMPGVEKATFITTSYEHDEYGATNEEPTTKGKMMEKRAQKLRTFIDREFNSDFYGFEIINPEAKNFYITMGINRYAIESHIQGNLDLGLIVVKSLYPFDPRLKSFLDEKKAQIEKLVFVEMNHSGQLEDLVRKECELYGEWNEKIESKRKYILYPFFKEEFE